MKDRTYEIALNPKCDRYQSGLASMMNKSFHEKAESVVIMTSKARLKVNEVLAQEIYKPVTEKFK